MDYYSRSAWRCKAAPSLHSRDFPHLLCFRVLILSLCSHLISRLATYHSARPYMEQHTARTQGRQITFPCRPRLEAAACTHDDESFTHKFWVYVDFLWLWWCVAWIVGCGEGVGGRVRPCCLTPHSCAVQLCGSSHPVNTVAHHHLYARTPRQRGSPEQRLQLQLCSSSEKKKRHTI